MQEKLKNVIFDLDGTLIDSEESILTALKTTLKINSITPRIPLTKEIVGPPLVDTLKELTGHSDPDQLNTLVRSFVDIYDNDGYKESVKYRGVDEILETLKKRSVQMYIATNKRNVPTLKILEHFKWTKYFRAVYAIDSSRNGRYPSKEITIKDLLSKESLCAKKSIYVGDRSEDFEAAQSNSLDTILVGWGYGSAQALRNLKAPIVHTPEDLISLIVK